MKKILCLAILVLLSLFNLNCNGSSTADAGEVNNYIVDNLGQTGAEIYVVSDLSQGQYGWFRVQKEVEGSLFLIQEGSTLINQTEYEFLLDPGKYWVEFSGINFTGTETFEVKENEMTEVVVYLEEVPLIDVYTNTLGSSPSGMAASGVGQEIFRFNMMHSGTIALTPFAIDFEIQHSGGMTIENCYLRINTLAGLSNIAGPINPTGLGGLEPSWIQFNGYYGNLDMTIPVYPMAVNTYSLACDVWAPYETVLRARIGGLGFINENDWPYVIHTWAEGYWLSY